MTDPAARPYRTELPNLIDDLDLSVYAFRLYVHIKRVSGANGGSCYQGTRALAEHCHMSVGQISKAKQELLDKGLVTKTQRPVSGGLVDDLTPVDMWDQNYERYGVHTVNTTVQEANTLEPETGKGVHTVNEGVHVVNTGVHTVNERKNQLRKNNKEERDIAHARKRAAHSPKDDPTPAIVRSTLADVCGLDLTVCSKEQIIQVNTVAKRLFDTGAKQGKTADDIADTIRYVASYFSRADWRGKKGDRPTPKALVDIWGAAIKARTPQPYANGRTPSSIAPDANDPQETARKLREMTRGKP